MTRRLLPLLTALLTMAAAAQAQSPPPKAPLNADALTRFPAPGRMVDVGGRRLHLLCKGAGRGPTVILETGAFASSLYYWKAQDEVAKAARVCVYDRAGLGWSDPSSYPRSLTDRVEDLHALAHAARLKGRYVLVGHSMGALIVRAYAKKYPRDVAALVLVEGSDPAFNGRPENLQRVKATVQQVAMAITAAEAGVDIPQLKAPGAPPEEAVALRASVFRAGRDDMSMMATLPDQLAQTGPLGALGDTPVVIVRRGKRDAGLPEEMDKAWIATQEANVGLSTRSKLMVAENSGHNVPHDQPQAFGEAVRAALAMLR